MINTIINNPFSFIDTHSALNKTISQDELKRFVKVAFPFLSLYQPTAVLVATGSCLIRSYSHLSTIVNSTKQREWGC